MSWAHGQDGQCDSNDHDDHWDHIDQYLSKVFNNYYHCDQDENCIFDIWLF